METKSVSYFFVIAADRDGKRKYVSRTFPRLWQYSNKLSGAQRFQLESHAEKFIQDFNEIGKYEISNPEIIKICRTLEIAT
ncbi:MAG: hypothetical protein ACRC3H_19595 [Lachnospiraceae bacterium]